MPDRVTYFAGYLDNWETTGKRAGVIEAVSVHNNDASNPVRLDIWITEDGSAATDAYKLFSAEIAAGSGLYGSAENPVFGIEGHAIPASGKVFMQASPADKLSARITGRK